MSSIIGQAFKVAIAIPFAQLILALVAAGDFANYDHTIPSITGYLVCHAIILAVSALYVIAIVVELAVNHEVPKNAEVAMYGTVTSSVLLAACRNLDTGFREGADLRWPCESHIDRQVQWFQVSAMTIYTGLFAFGVVINNSLRRK